MLLNTFLVSACFREIARVLDSRRLNKQALEVLQILNILHKMELNEKVGYSRHPAVLQWRGFTECLKDYYNCMREELISRNFNISHSPFEVSVPYGVPWFVNCTAIHNCHKASLIRKDRNHYEKFFPSLDRVYTENGYVWPSHLKESEGLDLCLDESLYIKYCVPISKPTVKKK